MCMIVKFHSKAHWIYLFIKNRPFRGGGNEGRHVTLSGYLANIDANFSLKVDGG